MCNVKALMQHASPIELVQRPMRFKAERLRCMIPYQCDQVRDNKDCALPVICTSVGCLQDLCPKPFKSCSPSPPPPLPPSAPPLPPLNPGEVMLYIISWNATYQTTVEAFPTDEYIANVSAALGVPASSVSVTLSPGSVVAHTRVGVRSNATEAKRIAAEATTICAQGAIGSCTTTPAVSATAIGGGSIDGDPHLTGTFALLLTTYRQAGVPR